MDFKDFRDEFIKNFSKITKDIDYLFQVELDKDELWNLYLDSFPDGSNNIFRERREHDCSCCRSFIKNFGNVVIIKNGIVKSVWDFETGDYIYQTVINALNNYVKTKTIRSLYVTKQSVIGTSHNFERFADGTIKQWDHFYINLPKIFVDNSSRSEGEIIGNSITNKNVFKRSLEEISEDSILTVLELISQNSLYKGEEWKEVLTQFLIYKKEFDKASDKEVYVWEKSVKTNSVITKIKNHSIGTLLINISEEMELDEAVKKYEAIVAPENYKRPKAIFTTRMIEDAQKKIVELGLEDSLGRRYSTLNDISINDILFSNKDAAKRIKGANIFEDLKSEVKVIDPKKFSKIEEISIEDFIKNVLPTATSIEALLENRHSANLVSLISPENIDSKTMFKWNNNFSWAYAGNITDSSLKENVKSAGGKVDGVLRFSIQWNDDEHDPNDLDAHCNEPNGNHIYFGNDRNRNTTGMLDVDIRYPKKGVPAVENITWTNIDKMEKGTYLFYIKNYSHRGGTSGFKAEIEFNGEIHQFNYNKGLRQSENIEVAKVFFDGTSFKITPLLPSTSSSKEIWGLTTNNFVPVTVIMNSPNHWEGQNIGNKHYFFMLKDCINSENPNGFYNEFLKQELLEHKRVFEALGSKMRVKYVEDQLSGLGFSSTKRNELIVKVEGQTKRILKIKF